MRRDPVRRPSSAADAARRVTAMSGDEGATPPTVSHPTPSERVERGKETRHHVPRSGHAIWTAAPGRLDPVELLRRQAESRVPELVPLRYARMVASPFAFYRGAAFLMAADLAGPPRTDLTAQLCGDAHLANFGVFAAPDRRLVFSINDFDETMPGPFEWDLKRLVTSFVIAGGSLEYGAHERNDVALEVARAHREAMQEFASKRSLDTWYARFDLDQVEEEFGDQVSSHQRKRFEHLVAKTRAKDSIRAVKRLTHVVDGELRFVSDPPLVVPVEELVSPAEADRLSEVVHGALHSYRSTLQDDRRFLLERFRFVHLARKVVGVGSVGTRTWIALLVGRDNDDPLVLQVKEAQSSVLEPFLGPSVYDHQGQRVVTGQRLMQSASDIMLGWDRITAIDGHERDFYIRQLWDSKGSARIEKMDPGVMTVYAKLRGWSLARAHARSGDAIAIAAYLGSSDKCDRAMAEFAESYAEQNRRDHEGVREAVATGELEAVSE